MAVVCRCILETASGPSCERNDVISQYPEQGPVVRPVDGHGCSRWNSRATAQWTMLAGRNTSPHGQRTIVTRRSGHVRSRGLVNNPISRTRPGFDLRRDCSAHVSAARENRQRPLSIVTANSAVKGISLSSGPSHRWSRCRPRRRLRHAPGASAVSRRGNRR